MAPAVNPLVAAVEAPPIAEAWSWIEGLSFPSERPLIDVAQALPGYPADESLRAFLAEKVRDPATGGYTAITGVPALREAYAADLAGVYGADITPADVMITAGCNQAFYLAMTTLAQAGDAVVLPSPWYFNHKMTLDVLGIETRPLPCRSERALVPDPDEAAALIDARTRAIVLVTPNNPTGAIYPPETIAAFARLARARGIALVLDETYKDFMPEAGTRPHALFSDPGWRDTIVQLTSFSKVFCLAGYRVGALAGAPALIGEAAKVMDCVAICAPHVGQLGAAFGLARLGGWREEKRRLMGRRLAAFRAALAGRNGGFDIVSAGAFFAFVRHPWPDRDATSVARRLAREHGLLALPGTMFGPGQERHLRFAFANVEESVMPAIAERLGEAAADR
jgi:aspartate/methionine/tyrosine aminotransferase